jgi:predicted nucleotidyltransferase
MTKIPERPQDIFVPLTQDYLKVFGNELVSLILYGSAAGGSYIRGKSDINLLVVLTPAGMDKFTDVLDTVKSWKKRRVAVPLIMTGDFIKSSLDSYPIEYLNMKNNHILIYGQDILSELNFNPADLRLQIERELRGKLILLRQGFLEAEGKARQIRQLISNSLTAFISIFNALLYFKQGKAPQGRRDTIKEAEKLFTIDEAVFMLCADIKEGKDKLASEEVVDVFKKYLREVNNICNIVDGL